MIGSATILGLIVAILWTTTSTPVYASTAVIHVSVQPDASPTAGELIQGERFSRELINSYVLMVDTDRVLSPVIEDFGLQVTPTELAKKISASSPTGTVLLRVSATDREPKVAANLANAVARSFLATAKQLEKPQNGAETILNAEILQPATPADAPVAPVVWKNLLAGIALGFASGVVLAILWQKLGRKWRGART